MPSANLAKAKVLAYRSWVARGHMLKRVRLYRRYDHVFPRRATIEVLRRLGAAATAIEAKVHAASLSEVILVRERWAIQAGRAIEIAFVAAAIREKIELQPQGR